uniref:BURP domain-containing protein n=1 Tax=Oryza punctata TaxID=4537 RepID=A0A0E0LAT8_ORYPU
MDVFVLLILLILLIGGSNGANMAVAVAKPSPTAMEYWQELFPETPMPPAILDMLTPLPTEKPKEVTVTFGKQGEGDAMKQFPVGHRSKNKNEKYMYSTKGGLKEVSVSYGSPGEGELREVFPAGYRTNNEHEHCLHGNKEELKEVSVSYGPEDEEKKSKALPTKYRSNNKFEKNWATLAAEGLKEVSVSYGIEGKEEPRKAFPMGRYISDNEKEMTSRTDKEGLREVSVSYGSEGEVVTWKAFPMEQHLLDKELKRNMYTNKGLKEVSVSYGSNDEEKTRKAFRRGYSLDNDYEKSLHIDKAGLKEVSVMYGSGGEEEPRKTFSKVGYMLDKERKKSSNIDKEELREVSVSYGPKVKLNNLFPTEHKKYMYTNEEGLKEVSVSYGSNGEEETSKTTPMGGYMVDKKHEKSLQAEKEGLKEVSVSYGSDVKLGNLFPIEHKKYIYANGEGLEEVTVSYGSNGEEETSKTFAMEGYMVDKEHEKSLQGEKEGLKEVSVSYGSNGEEETRKTIPMGGYMVDREHKNSLQMEKGMDHGRHVHAHSNKMQLADVFFFHDALRPGSVITPTIPPTTSLPAFLPRHVADTIPFTVDRFADVVAMFAPASLAMAREIRWALDTCGQHPRAALLPGEKAGCATSLESLADLAASLLGTRDVRAFSAADLPTDGPTTPARRGRYNVTSVRELSATAGSSAAGVVACHDLTYPYAVFYCHSTKPTAAYAVTLVAATTGDGDGDGASASPATMEALAVCHLDTSRWRADNPFFVAHGVKPGEVSVCHFLTKLSIVWVPRNEQGGPRAA